MSLPSFTIITPVYNGAAYLESLIRSVQAQAYPALEHMIIDDGSTDGGATCAILEQQAHLRWWARENRGQYATMNEGLRAAAGEWVCFISADDLMAEKAVSLAASAIQAHPGCDVVYGKTRFIRQDGQPHPVQPWFARVRPRWYAYLPGIYHCSLYVRRSRLLEENLFFDEALRYTGDYDWIMRLIRAGLRFEFTNHMLSLMRTHSGQASVVHKAAQDEELERLRARFGVNRWLYNGLGSLAYLRSVGLEVLHYSTHGQGQQLSSRARAWYRRKIRRG